MRLTEYVNYNSNYRYPKKRRTAAIVSLVIIWLQIWCSYSQSDTVCKIRSSMNDPIADFKQTNAIGMQTTAVDTRRIHCWGLGIVRG